MEETTVKCFIPLTAKNASLNIYDLTGRLIKSCPVTGRDQTSVTIAGAELNAGMYIYSLIIDNKEIDSKRMILKD